MKTRVLIALLLLRMGVYPNGHSLLGQEEARSRIEGSVAASNLASRVAPDYPPLARAARITGAVVLEAVIDKEGRVGNLKVVRGQPLLNDSAIQAVQQWRYKPHHINGESADVVTTVTISFALVYPQVMPSGSASISGQILHADGKPAAGVTVNPVVVLAAPAETPLATPATSFREVSGEYRVEATGLPLLRAPNLTDSSGHYQISGLGAANYRVAVVANQQTFYYPGTRAVDEAVAIPIESNQATIVGIDFSIP